MDSGIKWKEELLHIALRQERDEILKEETIRGWEDILTRWDATAPEEEPVCIAEKELAEEIRRRLPTDVAQRVRFTNLEDK